MNAQKPVVEVVENQYRFRRGAAHFASVEAVEKRIAKGWLVHSHTSDDVEVYDIQPECPGYIRTQGVERVERVLSDGAMAAVERRWDDLKDILAELAGICKALGLDVESFMQGVREIEQRAAAKTENPLYAEFIRSELRARRRQFPNRGLDS